MRQIQIESMCRQEFIIHVAHTIYDEFVIDGKENIKGKEENADNHYFWFCSHIYFVMCKCFQLGPDIILLIGKQL